MRKFLLILTFLFLVKILLPQVAINDNGSSPDNSAGLDVNFTDKGVLIPRVSLTSISDVNTIPNPATSLIVYNDGNGGLTPAGFYYNAGTSSNPKWLRLLNNKEAWLLTGNSGTAAGTHFLGTTDNQALDIRTNNVIHWRFNTNGGLEILNTGYSVFIGEGAGASDDLSDNKNVFVGYYAGNQNNAEYSVAVGYKALEKATTGSHVALGAFALNALTSGEYNIGVGYGSLYLLTTGSRNVAIGYRALRNLETEDDNTAVGYGALRANTAKRNTAIGAFAMNNNTSGWESVAIGYGALYLNTTGTENVSVGYNSLRNNLDGGRNVALGFEALYYAEQNNDFNTAIGYQSMRSKYDCYDNSDYNTAVGAYSLYRIWGVSSSTALGYSALYNDSIGDYNTAVGFYALYGNTLGSNNTALGYKAGDGQTTNEKCTFIGAGTDASGGSFTNSTALGYTAVVTADNQIRIGNSSVTSIGGFTDWSNISDKRFKTNIREDVHGLDFILKLKPITYNLNVSAINNFLGLPDSLFNPEEIRAKQSIRYSGFIAQDVEKAAKSVGYDFSGVDKPKNPGDFYALRYAEFVVPLVKAVQEQQQIIENQNKRIAQLEQEVAELKKALEK